MFARVHKIVEDYLRGSWDTGLRLVDEFIAECEAGIPQYLEPDARFLRASMRAARGDLAGAVVDARRGLERAREGKDPQMLYPALARGGQTLAAAGFEAEATALADELLALLESEAPTGMLAIPELAFLFADYGRGSELLAVLDARKDRSTPWLEGARAVAEGDFVRAADVFGRIGAQPHEALARLHRSCDRRSTSTAGSTRSGTSRSARSYWQPRRSRSRTRSSSTSPQWSRLGKASSSAL
jgi:hypothetical protein